MWTRNNWQERRTHLYIFTKQTATVFLNKRLNSSQITLFRGSDNTCSSHFSKGNKWRRWREEIGGRNAKEIYCNKLWDKRYVRCSCWFSLLVDGMSRGKHLLFFIKALLGSMRGFSHAYRRKRDWKKSRIECKDGGVKIHRKWESKMKEVGLDSIQPYRNNLAKYEI